MTARSSRLPDGHYKRIMSESFWDRFTRACSRLDLYVAKAIDPAATNPRKEERQLSTVSSTKRIASAGGTC